MNEVNIKITKNDIDVYFKTFDNSGVIKRARMKIFNGMPKSIKKEFKVTMNDFLCVDEEKGIYQVVPHNCSDRLKKYLSNFNFILTNNENSI